MLERAEAVRSEVTSSKREVADLPGRAAGSAVELAADEDTGADADADLDVEGVVDPLRGATPALGQDERCTSLSTSTEQGTRLSRLASRSLPTAELGRQRHSARYRIDDARRADTDRPLQAAPVHRGGRQDSSVAAPNLEKSSLRSAMRSVGVGRADHLARQIGDDDQDLVRADVDPEHVAQVAAEAEQRAPARAWPSGVQAGDSFRHIPGREQKLHRAVDGRLDRPVALANSAREIGPSARIVRRRAAALSRRRSRG